MVYFRHMRGGLFTTGRSVRQWLGAHRFSAAPKDSGFSIVEIMIVLAVTGALFVSAAIMISGRQNQTAFDQAIREAQSQVQQAINEVAVGYFPDSASFQCSAGAAGQAPQLASGSASQGTNSDCIFLGKALQFGVSGTDPEQFAVYTIAGLRAGGLGGSESTSLGEARPMVVAPSSPTHTNADYPDNSVNATLQHGLKVVRMWYVNGGADVEIGGVAFVNSLAQYSGGTIVSGSGQVNMIALDGTSLAASKLEAAELMNDDSGKKISTGTLNPSGGIFICFESGTTDDYGIVKIGGDKRELAVSLIIKNKGTSTTCTS